MAILAKTATPHPRLPGTIFSVADEIRELKGGGVGDCLPVQCDIRFEDQVACAVAKVARQFGSIDILINNASAIQLSKTLDTTVKKWDLMQAVGARGAIVLTQACLKHLLQSNSPRIVNISPPLNMKPQHFGPHVAYTIAKYGMSMLVLGWAEEFKAKIAVNALWPKTLIDTAALNVISEPGKSLGKHGRTPEIMADALLLLLQKPSTFTGNFVVDEHILRESGVDDFTKYSVSLEDGLMNDLFLDVDSKI